MFLTHPERQYRLVLGSMYHPHEVVTVNLRSVQTKAAVAHSYLMVFGWMVTRYMLLEYRFA